MVCIYLPRHLGEEEEPSDRGGRRRGKAPRPAGETVLVVDDEPTVRMLIIDALRELGYPCLEAAEGGDGARGAEAHGARSIC